MVTKLVVIAAYIIVLMFIAVWSSRRVFNVGDFFLADRGVGPWVSAFAYGTTYFSAVLFVGYAGKLGWGFGLNTMWIVAGNVLVGTIFAWLVLARQTRQMTSHLDAITMPEFLEARYNSAILRPISALVVFIFLLPYSASVYKGLGHLFEANLGIDYIYAELLMAFFTGLYLLMGGYLAITITDFFQGLLQIFGVVVMILLLVGGAGGMLAATTRLATIESPALAAEGTFPGWLILLGLVVLTSVGPWGLPQMVQKFYSIKHTRDIKPAMIVSTFFSIIIAGGAYYCGALSQVYFTKETLPAEPDMIIPELVALHTPDWFSALILVVVLAASMSTLASLVLVASGAISIDLLGLRARGDEASKKGLT
ncbi:MAG: sodium:solute symporter family transporter, partial [Armatimonadota bacterium]